jgi:hypothetical protein
MILGLPDILATQSVDKLKNASGNAASNSANAQNFSDYLNIQKANLSNFNGHNIIHSSIAHNSSGNLFYKADENSSADKVAYNLVRQHFNNFSNSDHSVQASYNARADRSRDASNSKEEYTTNINKSPRDLSNDRRIKLTNLYNNLQNGNQLSDEDAQTLKDFLSQLRGVKASADVNGQHIASHLSAEPSDAKALAVVIGEFLNNSAASGDAKDSTPAITKEDLLNALDQLKNGSSNQVQLDSPSAAQLRMDIAGLSSSQLKILNIVLSRMADNGVPAGLSANDVIAQLVAQLKDTKSDFSVTADDILQKIKLDNANLLQNPSASQLATLALVNQPNGADISNIAKDVIEQAKNEAAKPQVSASDIQAELTAANSQDKHLLQSAFAQKSMDANFAGAKLTENIALAQQASPSGTEAFASLKQVVSQASDEKANIGKIADAGASGGGLLSGMSSENFVKFQNILNDVKAQNNNQTAKTQGGIGSPEDVVAQIQFGMKDGGGASNSSSVSVQLHPKELGKVDISIQVASDGKTHVMVMAEKTDTLNMLQKEAASLRDMLTDALKTNAGNLNFSFQQSGSDSWKQQFAKNQFGSSGAATRDLSGINSNYLTAQTYAYSMIATQGLDIRV